MLYPLDLQKLFRTFHAIIPENSPILSLRRLIVQKGEDGRERHYSSASQRKVTPGFWRPKFVTPSESGPRNREREEDGDVVGDYYLGRQYLLDHGFGPVTITFPVIFSYTIMCSQRI